jgi:hypothetical protein
MPEATLSKPEALTVIMVWAGMVVAIGFCAK